MSSAEKILKAIFIVLIFVIITEMGYYVYIQSTKRNNNLQTTETKKNKISITPISQSAIINSEKDREIANALLKDLKKTLDLSKHKVLIRSQKIDTYESTIQEIGLKSGVINIFKYEAFIALKYKPNEDHIIYLNKNDLEKTKVLITDNNRILPYDFSLLKRGDHVKIEIITNALEYFDKNTERITITKINE